ncbi:hypothetical protein L210DRAFT_2841410 [Boletus edulis BED1]|uniref:Uncharacterized protein n=1 Tax=Boletus edulis BED1 TaxID=1328754 RepID=A0AAD4GA38_BOLED|nr:hypothetical protein L210DRAFT_2841410 [Boletus edulis BED1]
MTTSILLRPPLLPSPSSSPSPSPSPVSTPLPALQADLSSSSSSASGSYLDLHRASARHIRFAPLPEPDRDLFDLHDPSSDTDTKPDTKPATQPIPAPDDFPALSPSVSPDSTLSSVRSTPTIRLSPNTPSKNTRNSNLKLLRPFSFLRRADSSSTHSASLPSSCNPSLSSLTRSSNSLPNSPSLQSAKLPRISTEDLFSFGRMSRFRPRSGSSGSTHPPRPSSPPPKSSKFLHRSASTSSAPVMKQVDGRRDWGEGSSQSYDTAAIAGSGPKKRRASSSASTPGAGGGRHSSVKALPNNLSVRPSTAPAQSSLLARPKKHVKMLNGRVYGAKRYAVGLRWNG